MDRIKKLERELELLKEIKKEVLDLQKQSQAIKIYPVPVWPCYHPEPYRYTVYYT